jgi:adenylate cyclase
MTQIIRYTGLLLIFVFSAFSILSYQFETDINNSQLPDSVKQLLTYPAPIEEKVYDSRMLTLLDDEYRDMRMVLAAIDERSLKELGRFPWSRNQWVPLIKKLETFGAKVISFDVVFSEPEKYLGNVSPDREFAKAIKEFQKQKGNKIILPYSINILSDEDEMDLYFKEAPDALFDFMLNTNEEGEMGLFLNNVLKTTFPIPELLQVKPALAYIGAKEDRDGIFRRYHLLANVEDLYFPSFSLLTYQALTGDKTKLNIKKNGDAILNTKKGKLYLNTEGETKLRWVGHTTAYPVIGISKILNANDDDKDLKKLFSGTAVFIGSTSFGAHDFRHTPVHNKLPGVFLHMNMVSMLLDGRFLQHSDESFLYSWLMLIVGSLLMFLITRFDNAIIDVLTVFILMLGTFLIDYFFFMPKGYEVTVFFILFSIVGIYSWETIIDFYVATKDKLFLKKAFENYISPELIDDMYKSGHQPKLGGDVQVLTAFFTDIQTFSTFSEKLSVSELVVLLNEYLSAMTDILLDEGGTLDKYEGDAIIAFFGAPMHFEDHAIRACRVAVKMQDTLLVLREKWKNEGERWPEIVQNMRHRIGLNSGDIMTGNMGSTHRMNYTMMGDSVNLAARLEEAAKQYGIFTHISEATKDLTGNHFETRELDTIRVVGKSEPVTTYELLGETGKTDELLINLRNIFHEGLSLYKNMQWDDAIVKFQASLELEYKRWPELKGVKVNPSELYIERCQNFKKDPPGESWDGVYTLTSK